MNYYRTFEKSRTRRRRPVAIRKRGTTRRLMGGRPRQPLRAWHTSTRSFCSRRITRTSRKKSRTSWAGASPTWRSTAHRCRPTCAHPVLAAFGFGIDSRLRPVGPGLFRPVSEHERRDDRPLSGRPGSRRGQGYDPTHAPSRTRLRTPNAPLAATVARLRGASASIRWSERSR
jgi:hypothetical protein